MRDVRSGGGKRRPLPPKLYGRQVQAQSVAPQTLAHALAHGFNPGTPGPYATIHDQRAARMEAHYHSPQTVGGLARRATQLYTGVDPAHPLHDPVALGMAMIPYSRLGRIGKGVKEYMALRRRPTSQLIKDVEAESMAEGAPPLHPLEKALIHAGQVGSLPLKMRLPGGGPRNNGHLKQLGELGLKAASTKGGPKNNGDLLKLHGAHVDRSIDAGRFPGIHHQPEANYGPTPSKPKGFIGKGASLGELYRLQDQYYRRSVETPPWVALGRADKQNKSPEVLRSLKRVIFPDATEGTMQRAELEFPHPRDLPGYQRKVASQRGYFPDMGVRRNLTDYISNEGLKHMDFIEDSHMMDRTDAIANVRKWTDYSRRLGRRDAQRNARQAYGKFNEATAPWLTTYAQPGMSPVDGLRGFPDMSFLNTPGLTQTPREVILDSLGNPVDPEEQFFQMGQLYHKLYPGQFKNN